VRRRGCGCAALGCAVPLVVLLVLAGAVGVLAGNWGLLARPKIPDAPPATADIPADYLAIYRDAAARFGLDWTVLAAVGEVETNHGRNASGCAPNSVGARGPMQFEPATFVHAAKLAGIAKPDICDPADAIPAAAALLRSDGAPADWWHALFLYNHVDWYPPLVLSWASRYGATAIVVWPIDGARITQGFGPTSLTLEPARCFEGQCYPHFHDGIDLAAPLGASVRAIAAGSVIFAGRLSDGAVVVEIDHGSAVSLYGHLLADLLVSEGESVSAGEPIGAVGLTGNTTGPHLHLGILVSGEPIDPLLVLPARP
jgi:murein DD-endopeptidase MepM/ murein hydrolase activator NlpD